VSETERSHDGLVSLLIGIGIGAILGAATALLLAPQSGAETRQRLRDRADSTLEDLRELIQQVRRRESGEGRHGDVVQDTESPGSAA